MIAAVLLFPISPASAHRSFAQVRRDQDNQVTGTVTQMLWSNPPAGFTST